MTARSLAVHSLSARTRHANALRCTAAPHPANRRRSSSRIGRISPCNSVGRWCEARSCGTQRRYGRGTGRGADRSSKRCFAHTLGGDSGHIIGGLGGCGLCRLCLAGVTHRRLFVHRGRQRQFRHGGRIHKTRALKSYLPWSHQSILVQPPAPVMQPHIINIGSTRSGTRGNLWRHGVYPRCADSGKGTNRNSHCRKQGQYN